MGDPIINGVLSYGAPGLIIGALLIVIKSLWNAYTTSQEARIKDGQESVKALAANAAALDKAASINADLNRTMQSLLSAVQSVAKSDRFTRQPQG